MCADSSKRTLYLKMLLDSSKRTLYLKMLLAIWFLKLYKRMTKFFLFRFLHVVNNKSVKWEPFFTD